VPHGYDGSRSAFQRPGFKLSVDRANRLTNRDNILAQLRTYSGFIEIIGGNVSRAASTPPYTQEEHRMTGRPVGQAHPDVSTEPGRQLARRRAPQERDAARAERSGNRPPAAGSDESYSKPHTERLEREVQALEAKLAISEVERLAERQTSEDIVKSLRAINEELSRSLKSALDTLSAATVSIAPVDELNQRVLQWDMSETVWDDTDDTGNESQPSRMKWFLKVLRAASPI
jgi:hypothetical protein